MNTITTDKLTIEHLAPYLPYKLKIYQHSIFTGDLISELSGGNIMNLVDGSTGYKPLLLPLSKCPGKIWARGTMFLIEEIKDGTLPYSKWLELVENHYDVNFLIESGLALNKLEYPK